MKRLLKSGLALAIALNGVGPAYAIEVRQGEVPKAPAALVPPQLAPVSAQNLAVVSPALLQLPAPLATIMPEQAQPLPSEPAAVTATAQLQAAAQALTPASPEGPASESAGKGLFDGEKQSWRSRAIDLAEMGQVAVAANFLSIFPTALSHSPAHPVVMGALWYGAAEGMAGLLAEMRRTVVGGWQASHDQRYRVDTNTGLLRDVRGHKYGSDRYEAYAPGKVSLGERIFAAAVSGAMGLWWVGADLKHALIYTATFGLLAAAVAIVRARRPPPAQVKQSAEDKAHAKRFNVSLASSPAFLVV